MARLLKKSHGLLTRALAIVALIFAILVLFQAKVFSLSPAQESAIGVGPWSSPFCSSDVQMLVGCEPISRLPRSSVQARCQDHAVRGHKPKPGRRDRPPDHEGPER